MRRGTEQRLFWKIDTSPARPTKSALPARRPAPKPEPQSLGLLLQRLDEVEGLATELEDATKASDLKLALGDTAEELAHLGELLRQAHTGERPSVKAALRLAARKQAERDRRAAAKDRAKESKRESRALAATSSEVLPDSKRSQRAKAAGFKNRMSGNA